MGRGLTPPAGYHRPEVEAVLEYGPWRTQFGADPGMMGTPEIQP